MRDDCELLTLPAGRATAAAPANPSGATVIPFPSGTARRPARPVATAVTAAAISRVTDLVTSALEPRSAGHPPTHLACLGALAGFAAQQSLLVAGGAAWVQPARAGHLDRLLLSETPSDASLWHALRGAAHGVGAQHLPDPQKLLAATLRCVGTTQLGRITLPLEYRLHEQPQSTLVQLWPRMSGCLEALQMPAVAWPRLLADAAARRVVLEHSHIPPHVALRVVMQSALAMALVEPRVIPGAATKPGGV